MKVSARQRWVVLACFGWALLAAHGAGPATAVPDRSPEEPRPPPLERWMDQLLQTDPAEHARLERMRRDNPEAFAAEIRQRVHEARLRRALEPYPEVLEAVRRLTGEEQARILQALGRGRHPRSRLPRRLTVPIEQSREIESEIAGLRDRLRQVSAPEEKEHITAELRDALGRLYDLRTQAHVELLDVMEQQIEEARARLRERREQRESWIEDRLRDAPDKAGAPGNPHSTRSASPQRSSRP